jgi:hypothetical protein
MTVYVDYQGSRYELAGHVNAAEAFGQIADRLNHSWRRQQNKTARPDTGVAYIAEDYDPWVHFPIASGGSVRFHVHDAMHLAFLDTDG